MKIFSREQIFQLIKEDITVGHYRMSDLLLCCSLNLFDEIVNQNQDIVTVVCGNNQLGEVGILLANLLVRKTNKTINVVHFYPESSKLIGILDKERVNIYTDLKQIKNKIEQSQLIVDCIFSIDLKENVYYPYDLFIDWINDSTAYIISADLPSGINCDNGQIFHKAVKANKTVAFQLAKKAYYLYPANELMGELVYSSVGITYEVIDKMESNISTSEYELVKSTLPKRVKHSHKGSYGKVLLIAGSENMSGAAILAAKSMLKCGVGLLTVMSYPEVIDTIKIVLPEVMTIKIQTNLIYQLEMFEYDKYDLIVFGPGFSRNKNTETVLQYLLSSNVDLLIDADGLYYLKNNLSLLNRKANTIITPHVGEYQRIFNYDSTRIVEDLLDIVSLYKTLTIVLKGENTIVATSKQIIFNTSGNNALAKGGSGDVLSGVIAAFYSCKKDFDSVVDAVYIHSLAADYYIKEHSSYSLMASDLIDYLDKVLFEMVG